MARSSGGTSSSSSVPCCRCEDDMETGCGNEPPVIEADGYFCTSDWRDNWAVESFIGYMFWPIWEFIEALHISKAIKLMTIFSRRLKKIDTFVKWCAPYNNNHALHGFIPARVYLLLSNILKKIFTLKTNTNKLHVRWFLFTPWIC